MKEGGENMTKVAIATSDGLQIDGDFSAAQEFYIYEVNDQGDYRFLERRAVMAAETSTVTAKEILSRLPEEVEGVLAATLDPYAARVLYDHGIIALTVNRQVDFALPIFGRKKRFLKRDGKILRFCGNCTADGCGSCHSIL